MKTFNLLMSSLVVIPQSGMAQKAKPQIQQRPNVIYVFPDQFRNFALGFWSQEGFRDKLRTKGDPVVTPNLDRFARESVVLSSAMSN